MALVRCSISQQRVENKIDIVFDVSPPPPPPSPPHWRQWLPLPGDSWITVSHLHHFKYPNLLLNATYLQHDGMKLPPRADEKLQMKYANEDDVKDKKVSASIQKKKCSIDALNALR